MQRGRQAGITFLAGCAMAAMIGAGCGSSTPIGALFPTAYAATINAKSAKLTIAVDIKTPKGGVTSTGSGGIDWGTHQAQVMQSVTVPGAAPVSTTEVIDGTDLYVAVPPAARSKEGGKPWIKVSLAQFQGSQGGGTQDPSQVLAVLNARSSSVTKVGTEQVDGVKTTHYRAQVDPTKAAPGASPAAQKLLAQLPGLTGSPTLPMDVWIDSTGKARQLRYSITIIKPPAGAPPAASQAFPETTNITLGLSHYGTPVPVTVPPPDQVFTQTLPGLSGGTQGA